MKRHTKINETTKVDQAELEGCTFAHNSIEEHYHPLVYKKFKCFKKNCKDQNCYLYHENENEIPIDMETEVDFDS